MLSQRAEVRGWKAVPIGIRPWIIAPPPRRDPSHCAAVPGCGNRCTEMAKILLVEDNELNRDMLSRRLQKRGHEVLIAEDGAQGVALAEQASPDLILLDMSLPVIDGWEAARRLKASPATGAIPIIALTAHAMSGDRER